MTTGQQLRFFIQRDRDTLRLEVAGRLAGAEVEDIYQCMAARSLEGWAHAGRRRYHLRH